MSTYTAIIRQADKCWFGWVQEIPGVNAQADTRDELIENLQITLKDMIEMYREQSLEGMEEPYEKISITA